MSRRKLAAIVALAAVAAAVLVIVRIWRDPAPAAAPAPGGGPSVLAARAGGGAARPGAAAGALPADPTELVAYLRGRFGKHIASRYVQMQMIEKLMRHFQGKSPDGWQAELLAVVRAAFPERYDEIAAMLGHRLDYEAWLGANEGRLRGLGERERREAMWEARKRLFGDAAEEIWASERKGQAVTDALAAIEGLPNATVGDRLAQYKESLVETHQENAETYLQDHRQEVLSRFLALDSVQRELGALPPAERSQALRDVRKGLGLDDAALGRWDTLDTERDRRWAVGQEYMAARAALGTRYAGAELETHLQELRSRYFGAEAATIADEEAGGFFRFAGPRKYGLN
ncbi:MAG TPA: hypothetical protein VNO30_38335 [Kofleriaceae bacterium]|nr:hypothetical protein [Kofleriaceae bacterium]